MQYILRLDPLFNWIKSPHQNAECCCRCLLFAMYLKINEKKIHIANKVKQKQENDFIMTGLWNEKYISDKCWAATTETAAAAAAAAKYQTYLVSHYLPDQSKYGATSNWFVCLHLAFSFRFLAINIFNALTLYPNATHSHGYMQTIESHFEMKKCCA